MHFGPILDNLEPLIGSVPERSKTIIMNMDIKIPLIFERRPEFLIYCRGSPTLNIYINRKKECRNEDHKCKVWVILGP